MTGEQAAVVLWSNDNGEISCAQHGGSYLRSAIAARPRARAHRTPLGTWERLTAGEVAELARMVGRPVGCETCAARSRIR